MAYFEPPLPHIYSVIKEYEKIEDKTLPPGFKKFNVSDAKNVHIPVLNKKLK